MRGFWHNVWFAGTNRQMVESVSQNAQRIRQYGLNEGDLVVEKFLDAVLAIAEHVDPYPRRQQPEPDPADGEARSDGDCTPAVDYDDLFPSAGTRTSIGTGRPLKGEPKHPAPRKRVPEHPEKDLLRFLLEHAEHLEEWQRDIIAIVREESLYFVPQMQTKIMNEGWASYWHMRIMRELDLTDDEFVEFGRLHSAVCTPGRIRINPYYVGLKMFEDIERRYGREKIFEVRELDSDVSFIRSYLSEELCHDLDLFVYRLQDGDWTVTDKDWERVRDQLCDSMTNFGHPYIVVEDGDYEGRRELYLKHYHDGQDLDFPYAERTLQHIYAIWQRPVHLETKEGDQLVLLTCDGGEVTRTAV